MEFEADLKTLLRSDIAEATFNGFRTKSEVPGSLGRDNDKKRPVVGVVSKLRVEAMGAGRPSAIAPGWGRASTGMEHDQVGARSLAPECTFGLVSRSVEALFSQPGLAGLGSTMILWNHLNRRGTCSVCPVVWEEGCLEAP